MLGTAKTRQETRRPDDAAELEKLSVKDLEGNDVGLSELWSEGPAVLVFLRHYG